MSKISLVVSLIALLISLQGLLAGSNRLQVLTTGFTLNSLGKHQRIDLAYFNSGNTNILVTEIRTKIFKSADSCKSNDSVFDEETFPDTKEWFQIDDRSSETITILVPYSDFEEGKYLICAYTEAHAVNGAKFEYDHQVIDVNFTRDSGGKLSHDGKLNENLGTIVDKFYFRRLI